MEVAVDRHTISLAFLLVITSYLMHSVHLSQALTAPEPPTNVTDQDALLSFKSSISNPSAAVLAWNDTVHFCRWNGVTCDDAKNPNRVTALSLPTLGLTGTISPSLSNLTFLSILKLQENKLHGPVPGELGSLPLLRHVNLSYNSLEGEIPESLTHSCANLKEIILTQNKIRGEIPANLSRCSNLELIFFNENQLTGDIPPQLGTLPKLQGLFLNENKLTGKIPHSIGNITSLTDLYLSSNNLEGSIPYVLGRIPGLYVLDLMFNRFSGEVPAALFNSTTLYALGLAGNLLTGALPTNFGTYLPNLLYLRLYNNSFEGPIPPSLANSSQLTLIEISNNRFSGPMLPNIGKLSDLETLQVGGNRLESTGAEDWGFITSLANCTQLQKLDLSSNAFRGTLSDSIGNLSKQLDRLWLRENQIDGRIPSGIGKLTNLAVLDMEKNNLSGPIPDSFGKLSKMQVLALRENKLSGEIPSAMGNLKEMLEIYLSKNALSGRIPSSFANFRKLEYLDLSYNNFNGPVPKGLLAIPSISVYLNLSHNSLEGPLPQEVGSLVNLKALDISENLFFGQIPASLGSCQLLEYINLEGNNFSGKIPESLNNLKGIQLLDLSRNYLSGTIPKFLETLPLLTYLNLSFNNFEGEVPQQGVFGNMSVSSILGNENLCGGYWKLNLASCTNGHHRLSISQAAIITISVVLLCLVILLFMYYMFSCKQNQRKLSRQISKKKNMFLQISYADLQSTTGGFSPVNMIGAGGFGTVYRGYFEREKMKVAVKVIHPHIDKGTKSFMAECQVLKNIRHRNLTKIITSCSTLDFEGNEFKALVYEFMPNGSLETWLHTDLYSESNKRNLDVFQRINIAIDIASAINYLHNQTQTPIVHCDLKPNNILLDEDMTAHVADFGLARILRTNAESSTIGIKGSIGYIAPECGLGGPISTLWDVYSYGILLLEMFTGKRPTDETLGDSLSLVRYVEANFPDKIMEVIDPHILPHGNDNKVRDIIHRCIESIIEIALFCAKEHQRERMPMKIVINHLEVTKNILSELEGLELI